MNGEIKNWEWPGQRTPSQKTALEVVEMKEENTGVFGFKNSPSLGNYLPDPVVVKGRVLLEYNGMTSIITIRLPKIELKGVAIGDVLAIGFYERDLVICAERIPLEKFEIEKIRKWVDNWNCTQE